MKPGQEIYRLFIEIKQFSLLLLNTDLEEWINNDII